IGSGGLFPTIGVLEFVLVRRNAEAKSARKCVQSEGGCSESIPSAVYAAGREKLFDRRGRRGKGGAYCGPFLQKPSRGSIYGKLTGIGENTLKTDIIHYLEGCDLTIEDVRVEYSRTFTSLSIFPSRSFFQNAVRSTIKKGHLYKLEEIDCGLWDVQTSYQILTEVVECFLSCYDFDASSLQMFIRDGFPEPIRMATVRFPSQIEATNAISMKNRSFILNNLVTMKLLQ
ncbi:uncharacterized protein, partial [Aristolochia californica]|uniref:uncharacterized protein n=1 Tax=Aristolochia californica TaxID=171875 RepID=UPI0035D9494B